MRLGLPTPSTQRQRNNDIMSDQPRTEQPNEAVKSLLNIEESTADLDSYKGQPMFVINKASRYPFSFGMAKAKLILKHIDALKTFVSSGGSKLS